MDMTGAGNGAAKSDDAEVAMPPGHGATTAEQAATPMGGGSRAGQRSAGFQSKEQVEATGGYAYPPDRPTSLWRLIEPNWPNAGSEAKAERSFRALFRGNMALSVRIEGSGVGPGKRHAGDFCVKPFLYLVPLLFQ